MARSTALTDAEVATLRKRVAAGVMAKDIATELGRSPATVTCYRKKLGLGQMQARAGRFVIDPSSKKLDDPDETTELRRCPFNRASEDYCRALRRLRECRACEVEAVHQEVRRALGRMVEAYHGT